ncbi:MAG TPA: DUF4129 domain-containing protein, partial [Actinomycetes bacterium]|nr:DUF4129 domain-containing protein [Actinomycetes bacterium]
MTAAALLAVVAMGSRRGPLGRGEGRPTYPADLVDTLLALLLVGGLAAGVLAVVALLPDQRLRTPRARRSGLVTVLLPLALVLAVWLFREPLGLLGDLADGPPPTSIPPDPAATAAPEAPRDDPGVVPVLVAGVAVLAMAGIVVGQLLAERRRRGPPRTPAELLVELLDDTLDDVEREPDPRRAVIAAWARMERGLAAAGLPRRASEAPLEYAGRVLATAAGPPGHPFGVPRTPPGGPPDRTPPVRPASVRRLTDLFERAKFSQHTIDRAMRDEAVAALRAVRADLAAAVRA